MLSALKSKITPAGTLVVGTLLFAGVAVQASVISNIDLEDASVLSNYDLVDSGVTYREKHIDHNGVAKPYLSTWVPSGTGRSIKFEHFPYTGTLKQRTEIVAKEHEPFNQWRYVGYQFAVSGDTQFPTDWTVITQFHQEGYFVSPMGELIFEPSATEMKLAFKIRNTDYYWIDGAAGPLGSSYKLWGATFTKNVWNKIVIGVRPGPGGNGEVQIWFNGALVKQWVGKLGFPAGFLSKPFVETYYNCFGVYRAPQNVVTKLYFDNYKWGTSYADVAP